LGYEPVGAEHGVTGVRITHIGGPTTLIQAEGWSLLTDPTFDDPGRRYPFGWGTSSRKMAGPAIGVKPFMDAGLRTCARCLRKQREADRWADRLIAEDDERRRPSRPPLGLRVG
jgi:hypothetical protein